MKWGGGWGPFFPYHVCSSATFVEKTFHHWTDLETWLKIRQLSMGGLFLESLTCNFWATHSKEWAFQDFLTLGLYFKGTKNSWFWENKAHAGWIIVLWGKIFSNTISKQHGNHKSLSSNNMKDLLVLFSNENSICLWDLIPPFYHAGKKTISNLSWYFPSPRL